MTTIITTEVLKAIIDLRTQGVHYKTIDAILGLPNGTPQSAYRLMKTAAAKKLMKTEETVEIVEFRDQ